MKFWGNIIQPNTGLKALFKSLILEVPNVDSGTHLKGEGERMSKREIKSKAGAQNTPPRRLFPWLKFPREQCVSNLTQSPGLNPLRNGKYLREITS